MVAWKKNETYFFMYLYTYTVFKSISALPDGKESYLTDVKMISGTELQ